MSKGPYTITFISFKGKKEVFTRPSIKTAETCAESMLDRSTMNSIQITNAQGRVQSLSNKIGNSLEIGSYMHCAKCIEENSISAQDYARLSVGFTPLGIQLWCNRHNCNVAHIDFQGARHPANMEVAK